MLTLLDFLHALPKAELHCYLLGTVRQGTFTELGRRKKAPLDAAEIEAFYTRGEKPVAVLRVQEQGAIGGSGSPAEFARFVQRQIELYARIVKSANIKE